ncbi:DUF6629 family protein [Streptomyces sp. 1331.2]|uniref:DUF6629 family protein n=1 Tax=Streptomyces sp. 1331.2 TaxID=1938835 RepID=UPI000BCFD8C0|nr:DUF6629 family protein [Streptomyces sp. 1331.2]SOB80029.1 hypothetical protein SAMN06272789_0733 [Streptomyces sp. 1331.2]
MCWSAQADTVAGGVVVVVGVACLVRVHRAGRPERLLLAAVPLVLGLHQLIEALVWLGTDGGLSAAPAAAARTAWAVIALPLLPVLVPAGVWSASAGPRRRLLAAFTLLGAGVAVPFAVAVAARPVAAAVHGHTLGYAVGIPHPAALTAGYFLATVGSLLASGDRLLRRLGLVIGAGAVVCALLWRLAFASTWCALAALAALLLLRWAGHSPDAEPGRRITHPAP